MDEPTYCSVEEFIEAYPEYASVSVSDIELALLQAENMVDHYTGCIDELAACECYSLCRCGAAKRITYSKFKRCGCPKLVGEITDSWPKNIKKFQVYEVLADVVIDGSTLLAGELYIATGDRINSNELHFDKLDYIPSYLCLLPEHVKKAACVAASWFYGETLSAGCDDCNTCGSFQFGSLKISKPSDCGSNAEGCLDQFLCTNSGKVFQRLLRGYRCNTKFLIA